MKKTNALRILDQLGIAYQLVSYQYDPENLNAVDIAVNTGLAPDQVFKTLVLKGDRTGILVAAIPSNQSLQLKILAKASGNKKIHLLPTKDLLATVGYIRGGCSPIGMKKDFPVFIDRSMDQLEIVYVNAGIRGTLFGVAPSDLEHATGGEKVTLI